jgi:hypothetical protein
MRAVAAALFLAVAMPAEAVEFRTAEAAVLSAQRVSLEPPPLKVHRPRRQRLELTSYEASEPSSRWFGSADRLDLVIAVLDRFDRDTLPGSLGVTARRLRNLLSPSENIRLKVKIDPLDGEYRAAVRVRF